MSRGLLAHQPTRDKDMLLYSYYVPGFFSLGYLRLKLKQGVSQRKAPFQGCHASTRGWTNKRACFPWFDIAQLMGNRNEKRGQVIFFSLSFPPPIPSFFAFVFIIGVIALCAHKAKQPAKLVQLFVRGHVYAMVMCRISIITNRNVWWKKKFRPEVEFLKNLVNNRHFLVDKIGGIQRSGMVGTHVYIKILQYVASPYLPTIDSKRSSDEEVEQQEKTLKFECAPKTVGAAKRYRRVIRGSAGSLLYIL